MIPFNKPYLTGYEMHYIYEAVQAGKISGNGIFTQKCQNFFEKRYDIKKGLLTTSCTDALEMCALLCDIKPGDEVIVPSYTFISTALAFRRQGAKIVFADSRPDHPGIAENKLENLITSKTKVIVPVHYAGISCDMDKIMYLADKYDLLVVEDAAQAIEATYKGKQLGTIGHMGTYSFHETKNIISGEGGMLAINDNRFVDRSEIIWEKGTNRASFYRGEVNKYEWVDIGSSFLPSEITAAFLWAQLENIDDIQCKRKNIWDTYHTELRAWANSQNIKQPSLPTYADNNAHMYYLCFNDIDQRQFVIDILKKNNIHSVFHYLSLHKSPYYLGLDQNEVSSLPMSDKYESCLLRLPLFYELTQNQQKKIVKILTGINFDAHVKNKRTRSVEYF